MSQPKTPLQKWEVLTSEWALHKDWYKVRRDTVRLPDGQVIDEFYLSIRPEVVLIFPVTPSGQVILARQYKHGAAEILLEFPGGIFNDPTEPPLAAAQRELREETGCTTDRWTFLATVYDDPAKQNNRLHLFLAEDVRPNDPQDLDPTEFIELVEVPLAELDTWILEGKIQTAGAIALAWHAMRYLEK